MKKTIFIRFTALLACLFFGCVTPENMSQTNPPTGSQPSIDIAASIPNEGPKIMLLRYDYPIFERNMSVDLLMRGQYFLDGDFISYRVETNQKNHVGRDGTFSFPDVVTPKMFIADDSLPVTAVWIRPDRKVIKVRLSKNGFSVRLPFVLWPDGYYHLSFKICPRCGRMHCRINNVNYAMDASYRSVRLKFKAESSTTNNPLEIEKAKGSRILEQEEDGDDYQEPYH